MALAFSIEVSEVRQFGTDDYAAKCVYYSNAGKQHNRVEYGMGKTQEAACHQAVKDMFNSLRSK